MKITLFCLLTSSFLAAGTAGAATSQWHEIKHQVLGGEGGWDLMSVDAEAHRIYVTRGDRVMVVDLGEGKLIGEVPGLKRAHGVALVPSLRRGYVSSGGDDVVVVFDLDSLKVVGKIPVDHNPDAMLYDLPSKKVLAFNGGSNSVSVIDAVKGTRVATIALPGKPELAESTNDGVYVNLEDTAKLARLDVDSGKVTGLWTLPDCEEPSGLAVDAARGRVFSVCQNHNMIVTDSRTGAHVASVPIGSGPDGAAFDPDSGNAFSSNSDGTLTIVHEQDPGHFSVAQTVSTPERSRCITFDPKTHQAILATAKFADTPQPSSSNPHPRPPMQAGSFGLLMVGQR